MGSTHKLAMVRVLFKSQLIRPRAWQGIGRAMLSRVRRRVSTGSRGSVGGFAGLGLKPLGLRAFRGLGPRGLNYILG